MIIFIISLLEKDHSMIETRRLKNVVILFPNNFKFCAVNKNYKYQIIIIILG